jgi:peptide/nickel transport system substrate-binding protein
MADRSMTRRPWLRGAATALAAVFVFAACGTAASPSPSGGAPSSPGATSQGTTPPASSSVDTSQLVIAVGSLGDQTWDPANSNSGPSPVKAAVGDTLLRSDPTTRQPGPGIAESVTTSADFLTTTIKLRDDVPFHDGYGNVTAEDVKFTIEQYLGPTSDQGNQMKAILAAVQDDPVKNIEIVSPTELVIHSAEPSILLMVALSNGSIANAMYIQSKKYWEEDPAKALEHPLGTGPFKFVSSTPGVEVKLEAVPDHWRQTATYQNVTFQIIPDDAARLSAVQSAAADFAVIPPSLAREAKNSGIKVLSVPDYANMTMIYGGQHPGTSESAADPDAFDPTSPWIQADAPEKGQLIREAMSLAVDRAAILEAVLAGEGTLVPGPILAWPKIPSSLDPSWTVPEYNLDLAKQKLAEGGYPDGFPLTFQIYENRPGNGQADVGEAVAGYLEALGLTVTRQLITDEQSDEYLDTPKSQGLVYIRFDPYMDESFQTLNNYWPEGRHRVQYDPVMTKAWHDLQAEPDPVKRAEITRSVTQHLIDVDAMGGLFTSNWTVATSDKVGTWTSTTGEGTVHNIESIAP